MNHEDEIMQGPHETTNWHAQPAARDHRQEGNSEFSPAQKCTLKLLSRSSRAFVLINFFNWLTSFLSLNFVDKTTVVQGRQGQSCQVSSPHILYSEGTMFDHLLKREPAHLGMM